MIILKIKVLSRPEISIQQLAKIIHEEFPHEEDKFIIPGIVQIAGEDDLICLKLEQDALTDSQRDYLHLSSIAARYIDSYEVDTNPIDTKIKPTLESWQEMKREMEDLRQRVSVLERNNSNVISQRFRDFFNGLDLPQAPQQETIDQGRLRELVYAIEDTVQRARNTLAPIYKDNTLNQVDTELGNAMDAILDLREILGEE